MNEHTNISVSFTGHRPSKLGGYDETSELITNIKKELEFKIRTTIRDGYFVFISGMAMGIDTWAAEIVLKLKDEYPNIKLICAVPFEGQESKWLVETKRRYWKILASADDVHIVSDGKYSPTKMQIRNEWMVDNSEIVIAVWDGTSGGTGNCVKYAKRKKRNMIYINPKELR